MNLTRYEQETIINFNEEETTASIYTHNKALCQRRGDFVVFRRTENVEKWRVKVYSLWIIILAVFACQA